jgi:hypothetical protein
VHRLPSDLGAVRFLRDIDTDLLGVAAQGKRRAVGLNAGIVGTALELPVIAHECGHILLGHDIGYCSTSFSAHAREERDAWESAALLAISREAGVALVQRRATVQEIAVTFGVPPALVSMRGALAVLLSETDGDRNHARASLTAARSSLEDWTAFLARSLSPNRIGHGPIAS